MHEIMIRNDLGFKWIRNGGVYTKGYIFDEKNSFKRDENLNRYFSNCNDEEVFRNILLNTNGFFAVIIETRNYIFAAVDRIRSVPIFYGYINGDFYISDDARYIKEKVKDEEMDEISKTEFLLTGYVTNSDTLYSNVKQIRAGEYLVFDKINNRLKLQRYFEFRHKDFYDLSEEELIEELDKVNENIMKRLIISLKGKTAVIPLSGGYDSRIIVLMLKRLGYENVICFTYGKRGNSESEVSKRIADYLGYTWFFIPYDKYSWNKWYTSEKYKQYVRFSDGLVSLPHIQDFPAVWELKRKCLIPENSVLIPGHTGFFAGSCIPESYFRNNEITKDEIMKSILEKHYILNKKTKNNIELENKFMDLLGDIENFNKETAADIYELWEWQERQSKFIVNSIRVYEFFEYEWRLPLADNEIINFWSRVPFELRFGKKLCYKYDDIKNNLNEENYDFDRFIPKYGFSRKVKKILRQDLQPLYKLMKNIYLALDYYRHPLDWYGIIDYSEFLMYLKQSGSGFNINSILSKHYLS